jgi:hypothetical protein
MRVSLDNQSFEIDETSINPGYGVITMLGCPGTTIPQFLIDFTTSGIYAAFPINGMVVLNVPDSTVQVTYENSQVQNTFLNLPNLQRGSITGSDGYRTHGSGSGLGKYAVPSGSLAAFNMVAEELSDFNFGQLWQQGVKASTCMYSDTGFAALPNATTLNAGQIVCPPTYWVSATPTRYALDVVKTPGTTGSPNGGNTTCTNVGQSSGNVLCTGALTATVTASSCTGNVVTLTTSTNTFAAKEVLVWQGSAESFFNGPNNVGGLITATAATSTSVAFPYTCYFFTGNPSDTGTLTISPLTDLSPNQYVTLGGLSTQISGINSENQASIVLSLENNATSVSSPTTLEFTAPVLGPEIQLLTKSAAAPSTGTWVQGDYVENSGATSQGIAGWVNTVAGTPGTWVGVPSGNTAGQLSSSQVAGVITNQGQTVNGACLGLFSGTAGTTTLYGDSQFSTNVCNANYNSALGGFAVEQSGVYFTRLNCKAFAAGINATTSGVVTVYDNTAAGPVSGVTLTLGTTTSQLWTGSVATVQDHFYSIRVTSAGSGETLTSVQCGVLFQ